jgi:hypothetical protein
LYGWDVQGRGKMEGRSCKSDFFFSFVEAARGATGHNGWKMQ